MSNAIFLDFKPSDDWQFLKELEENTGKKFDCIFNDSHNWHGKKKILRYLSYFFVPLKYALKNKYEVIVAWQQFYGLFYAFWLRLLKKKKSTKLVIMTFIYKKKSGLKGRLYEKLMRYIVEGKYVDTFICFSEEECEMYSTFFNVAKRKFVSCKLEVEDSCLDENVSEILEDDFYLAAGRSNRNYKFLCEAFGKMPSKKLVIICDSELPENIPENIVWKCNVHGSEYLDNVSRCKAVIVPLDTSYGDISAGQLVIIQGMMFGKIVVATETLTTREYIHDQQNGLLINNNCKELADILDAIECGEYDYMKRAARKYYKENYSGSNMAKTVAQALKELEGF